MKKMTSVIAIILLAALLFAGCDVVPVQQDFSKYGFTFTIAGKVTEREGNTFGDATFTTKYGQIAFAKYNDFLVEGIKLTMITAQYKEPVGDNATLYTFTASEGKIRTCYLIEIADGSAWLITVLTPEADYNKDALVKVFQSVKFITAS